MFNFFKIKTLLIDLRRNSFSTVPLLFFLGLLPFKVLKSFYNFDFIWGLDHILLSLLAFILFVVVLYEFVPIIMNLRFVQYFFLSCLVVEDMIFSSDINERKQVAFFLFSVLLWAFHYEGVFIALLFLFNLYCQMKRQFLHQELLFETVKPLKIAEFKSKVLTSSDVIYLMNSVTAHVFKRNLCLKVSSNFRFHNIGVRLLTTGGPGMGERIRQGWNTVREYMPFMGATVSLAWVGDVVRDGISNRIHPTERQDHDLSVAVSEQVVKAYNAVDTQRKHVSEIVRLAKQDQSRAARDEAFRATLKKKIDESSFQLVNQLELDVDPEMPMSPERVSELNDAVGDVTTSEWDLGKRLLEKVYYSDLELPFYAKAKTRVNYFLQNEVFMSALLDHVRNRSRGDCEKFCLKFFTENTYASFYWGSTLDWLQRKPCAVLSREEFEKKFKEIDLLLETKPPVELTFSPVEEGQASSTAKNSELLNDDQSFEEQISELEGPGIIQSEVSSNNIPRLRAPSVLDESPFLVYCLKRFYNLVVSVFL